MQALMLVRSTFPACTSGAVVDGVVERGSSRKVGDMVFLDGDSRSGMSRGLGMMTRLARKAMPSSIPQTMP